MRSGLRTVFGVAMATALAWLPLATKAQDTPSPDAPAIDQNVFVLGGPFQSEWVWETAVFWRDHYEDNFFAGVGYQNFIYHSDWGLKLGAEVGLGVRVGDRSSAELWTGVVARYDGLHLGDINISPSISGGLSVVTGAIGVEAERANAIDTSVPVLFYMGPEIAISHASNPNLEVFARVHHRSGGYGIIERIDGSNAATLGLRFKF